jgi:hypothetical protein
LGPAEISLVHPHPAEFSAARQSLPMEWANNSTFRQKCWRKIQKIRGIFLHRPDTGDG